MSEYKRKFSSEEKRAKLKTFNSVYYDGNPNIWKVSLLPNWMEFYGRSLDNELNHRTPTFYRKFKPGTIVMVDYGVTVGSEMAGRHFAVVLSKNDTKYTKTVIVVPLSSKYHKNYVSLGKELLKEAQSLGEKRVDEIQIQLNALQKRFQEFISSKQNEANFELSEDSVQFLRNNSYSNFDIFKHQITFNLKNGNKALENAIVEIKGIPSWETYKDIFEFASFMDTLISFQHSLLDDLQRLEKEVTELKKLVAEIERYNANTYANINGIRSISKLRVSKFSKYSISGNISVSPATLDKLKTKLSKIIDI